MDSLAGPQLDKRRFVNRAQAFVNHARHTPAFPLLELLCLTAAGLAVVSGAFGTASLSLGQRGLFWLALMAWNALKWRLWFASLVRGRQDWRRASAIGALVLNLPLPLEITAGLRLVGVEARIGHATIWLEPLVISAMVAALAWAIRRMLAPRQAPTAAPAPGPLVRAGARLEDVCAVRAEDHYCRVFLTDRSSRLVLARFGDVLTEMGALDGARIHRSAWVADRAVERAERDGRAWRLVAVGQPFPVSAAHVAGARRRGWLNRR
jgi:hypothetical protein